MLFTECNSSGVMTNPDVKQFSIPQSAKSIKFVEYSLGDSHLSILQLVSQALGVAFTLSVPSSENKWIVGHAVTGGRVFTAGKGVCAVFSANTQ